MRKTTAIPESERVTQLPSWLLGQLGARAYGLVSDELATLGSKGYHYRILASLVDFGPASQAELGRRTGIDTSDIVAALNELSANGYVQRTIDSADRRRNVIMTTTLGKRQLQELEKKVTAAQEALMAPLSRDEQAELLRLLRVLLSYHGH